METASVSAVGSYDAGLLASVANEVLKNRRDPVEVHGLRSFRTVFKNLNGERNRVSHGLWVPFMKGGTMHYAPRGKLRAKSFNQPAKELKKI